MISMWVLVFMIVFSSLTILPLLLLPSIASAGIGMMAFINAARSKNVRMIFISSRKYFLAFIVINLIYAALIGVNVLDPHLYRHEFKYMVSFFVFITLSMAVYPKKTENVLFYAIVGSSIFSFSWFLFSLLDRSFYSLSLYPYLGVIWEHVGGEPVYLGPFQNHNSAGGFYAILSLILLGIMSKVKDLFYTRIALLSLILVQICFFFTDSRAYFLVLSILSSIMLGIIIYRRKIGNVDVGMYPKGYVVGVVLLLLFSGMGGIRTHMYLVPNFIKESFMNKCYDCHKFRNINGLRPHNITTRFFLWKKAWKDFYQSPIIGVGASRFDSDKEVINSAPRVTLKEVNPELLDLSNVKISYIKGFLYRINVSKVSIHLEQETHNAYLQVLAEGGVVMFLLFAVMYYSLYMDLNITTTMKREEFSDLFLGLAVGARNSLICLCISSMFGSHLLGIIPLLAVLSLSAYLISFARQYAPEDFSQSIWLKKRFVGMFRK